MSSDQSPSPSSIVTRQLARNIAGIPTEILLQIFDDRTLILVTQGKVGRLLQVSPPSSNTRRRPNFDYDEDEDRQDGLENEAPSVHDSLLSTFLPPPDVSSNITSLFGTARSEESNQTDHLFASQIAAILFHKKTEGAGVSDQEVLDTAGRPVVVGLGLKAAADTDGDDGMQRTRDTFRGVMEMVSQISGR